MQIKGCLLLGRKVMTNIGSLLKSRDIILLAKVRIVEATVFPVVMYGCESWTIKKAESWRIDAFELWCWRRLLRVFARTEIKPVNPKGNQPWIFIRRTDAEAEAQHLLLLFSCSVMSNSLWPHGLKHARPPCPLPSPRACSNSCSLSQWCHPTISSSVVPFSTCLQSFPASESFLMSQLLHQVAKVLELQL